MRNQSVSARLLQVRRVLVGPLAVALVLGAAGARAQTVTPTVVADTPKKPLPTDVVYYVDGKPAAPDALNTLNPQNIDSVDVLKGKEAQALTGKATGAGVILVTTKANANSPQVLAFNKKHNVVLRQGTLAQSSAMGAARAYIEKTSPNAKIQAVYQDKKKAGHYVVHFEEGGQTKELHFDGQGQPVAP